MTEKQPATYIMASRRNGTLYIGVTSNLIQRIHQHRTQAGDSFVARYGCTLLVAFEWHADMPAAITREKQLKAGSRAKKLALIEATNPQWQDLYPTLLGTTEHPTLPRHREPLGEATQGPQARPTTTAPPTPRHPANQVIAGIGCRRNCPATDIIAALRKAEAAAGVLATALATPHFKQAEPGLQQAAATLNLPLHVIDQSTLEAAQPLCPTRSAAGQAATGLASIAEAAAIARGTLIPPRVTHGAATCALANGGARQ